jgi:autotransporter-associated beta strand protein
MKKSIQLLSSQICFALIAVLTLGGFQSTPAASRYWSSTTSGAQVDGGGTWEAASQWRTTSGGSIVATWNNATPDTAFIGIGGTPGTITVGAATTFAHINFKSVGSGNYILTGGVLTIGAGTPLWTVDPGVTVAVASTIGGGARQLNKEGTGTLIISGIANTFTSYANLNNGTTEIKKFGNNGVAQSLGTPSSAAIATIGLGLNGAATLKYTGTANGTGNRAISLKGNGTIDGSGTVAFLLTANASGICVTPTTGDKTFTLRGTFTGAEGSENSINGIATPTTSGTLTLYKDDAGSWQINNASTYTGQTDVKAGSLRANNATALGTTAGNTIVRSGAELKITATGNAEPVILYGDGISSAGALRLRFGTSMTFSGPITLALASRINSDNSSHILSGGVNGAGHGLTIGVGGTSLEITTTGISGTGTTLTKDGSGILTLSIANSYTGNTTISAGTLKLSGSGAIASSPNITVAGVGTLDVSTLTTALTLETSQTLKASGNGSSGTIATTTSKGLTMGATSGLQFTAYDGATAPLTVTGAGGMTLAVGNPVTVTVPGSALAIGSYKLIAGSTLVLGTAPSVVTVDGDGGKAANTTATLRLTGGELFMDIKPNAPTAGNNGPVCAGGTLSLTASTVSDATYSWTGPLGFTSSDQNPTVSTSATTGMSGTYSVTVTVNGLTSAAGTTDATVNAIPSAPTAGNNGPVCAGGTLSLTATTVSDATYSWTGPLGFTSSDQNPTVSTSATTGMSGNYSVTATVSGCTSSAGTTGVTVNALPSCSITGVDSVLPSTTGHSYSAPAGMTTYAWSITGNGTINGASDAQTVSVDAGAVGSFDLHLAITNTCGNSSCDKTVTVAVPTLVYVDDGFAGLANGATTAWPCATGPTTACPGTNIIGYDAFATVQAAVTAVAASGAVNVAAGTYAGNITINKALTLVGDPGDVSAGPGPSAPVIDGGSLPGDGFLIANGVTDVTIKGFEIRNFTSNDTGIGNGISAWETSTANITIQDNYFHNLGWDGVLVGNDSPFSGEHSNWTIKANILETFEAYGFELTNTKDSTIENNVIHASSPANPVTCIMIMVHRSESGITIKGNTIDGALPPWLPDYAGYAAIFVAAGDSGGGVADPCNLDNVLIENNTISTTGARAQVYLANYAGGTVTGVHAHGNSFSTFRNSTPAAVDATSNWWERRTPPPLHRRSPAAAWQSSPTILGSTPQPRPPRRIWLARDKRLRRSSLRSMRLRRATRSNCSLKPTSAT